MRDVAWLSSLPPLGPFPSYVLAGHMLVTRWAPGASAVTAANAEATCACDHGTVGGGSRADGACRGVGFQPGRGTRASVEAVLTQPAESV